MDHWYQKKSTFLLTAILVTAILAPYSSFSLAEDAQVTDSPTQTSKHNRDGYSLSIGLGYVNIESPLRIEEQIDGLKVFIDGYYQWKGFFVELANDPARDKNLPAVGYNFYSTDHWNLDLIAAVATGRTEFNYRLDGEAKQIKGGATRGFGFRAQGAWGNSIVQMVALPFINKDVESNSALNYASLWVGHRWQVKNWSVNGSLGAIYQSRALLDHHFGVTEDEADHIVWAYEPSSGIDYKAHIDLSYPVSKNTLFQIYSKHTQYSGEILDSPLIELARRWENRPEREHEFGIILNYVF